MFNIDDYLDTIPDDDAGAVSDMIYNADNKTGVTADFLRAIYGPDVIDDIAKMTLLMRAYFDQVGSAATEAAEDAEDAKDATQTLKNDIWEIWGQLTRALAKDLTGIQPGQMTLFEPSVNLFADKFSNFKSDGYYYMTQPDANNVRRIRFVTVSNWRGWLVPVKPNTTYTMGPCGFNLTFYTSDFKVDDYIPAAELNDWLSDDAQEGTPEPTNTVTSGENSYWMAITQKTDKVDRMASEWMLVEGDSYPEEYVSGYPRWIAPINGAKGHTTRASFSYSGSPIRIVYTKENNNWKATVTIPSGAKVVTDEGAISTTGGEVLETTNAAYLGYHAVDGWKFASASTLGHDYYMIGWIRPSQRKAILYANYTECTDRKTKIVGFFGDSITAGVATSKTYHEYLHDIYGFTCYNYGYGGAGYLQSNVGESGKHGTGNEGIGVNTTNANQLSTNTVLSMLQRFVAGNTEPDNPNPLSFPDSFDAIVIFAGTNDWSHNSTISLEAFASKVEATFNYYHNNFSNTPLLVMTPIHRTGDTSPVGKELSRYVDIIIEKCRDHGIPYVDTFTMSGLQPNNINNRTAFFDDGSEDGNPIHPSSAGHRRIMRAIGETLNQLVKWREDAER